MFITRHSERRRDCIQQRFSIEGQKIIEHPLLYDTRLYTTTRLYTVYDSLLKNKELLNKLLRIHDTWRSLQLTRLRS